MSLWKTFKFVAATAIIAGEVIQQLEKRERDRQIQRLTAGPSSSQEDLPLEGVSAAISRQHSLAEDAFAGTDIYDPATLTAIESPLTSDEREEKHEKQAAINRANSGAYSSSISLKKGGNCIRVLLLKSSPFTGDRVYCELVRVDMNSKYDALSYTWGAIDDMVHITIQDFQFAVTRELEETLRHLRSPTEDRRIWIDAICMNQSDSLEMSWHLNCMRDIYAKAQKTFIWLGNGTPASDKAFEFFSQRSRGAASVSALIKDYKENPEPWSCLEDIVERRWWSRLWIVQEVIVSKSPEIVCGNKHIAFDVIPKMVGIAIKHNLKIFQESSLVSKYRRNINLLEHFHHQWTKSQSPDLEWWIRVFGVKHGCEQARDKIFALRALAGDCDSEEISSLRRDESVRSIYQKVTRHIISDSSQPYKDKHLDFICIGRGARRNKNFDKNEPALPSWVPDLTLAPWESYPTLTRKAWLSSEPRSFWRKGDDFHAGQPSEFKTAPFVVSDFNGTVQGIREKGLAKHVDFSSSGSVLHIKGVVEDQVEYLGQEYNLNITPQNLKEAKVQFDQRMHHINILSESFGLAHSAAEKFITYPRTGQSYHMACSKTLVADRDDQNRRLGPDRGFLENFDSLHSGEMSHDIKYLEDRFNSHSMRPHFQRLHRCFMVSEKGYLGLVPPETRKGDLICVLYGCSVPVILRPTWDVINIKRTKFHGEFIGECYVHGIMDGEVVQDVADRKQSTIDIQLE